MRDQKLVHWNKNQKLLKSILPKKEEFSKAIELCLQQHATLHSSEVTNGKYISLEDELWENLDDKTFREFVKTDHGTIARNIWHATRIEDLTLNLLVANEPQVLNSDNRIANLNCKILTSVRL